VFTWIVVSPRELFSPVFDRDDLALAVVTLGEGGVELVVLPSRSAR